MQEVIAQKKIWSIGDILIDEIKGYKYLGITIKVDGSFTEHVSSLIRDKANKAYFSLIAKNKEWQVFNPKLFFHVFDNTILPINYGAEVWRNNP